MLKTALPVPHDLVSDRLRPLVPGSAALLGHGGAGAGGDAGSPAHRSVLGRAAPEPRSFRALPRPEEATGTCAAVPPGGWLASAALSA